MTKLKISLWMLFAILVGAPIGYIGYLNHSYFLQASSLTLVLEKPININYASPEITNIGYWVGCIIVTWLVISIIRLPKYFRTKKIINLLQEQVADQKIEIAQLLAKQNSASLAQPEMEDTAEHNEETGEVIEVEATQKSAPQ